jgi:hypothetical protein
VDSGEGRRREKGEEGMRGEERRGGKSEPLSYLRTGAKFCCFFIPEQTMSKSVQGT